MSKVWVQEELEVSKNRGRKADFIRDQWAKRIVVWDKNGEMNESGFAMLSH